MADRLVPNPVGVNAEFYAYVARGELRLQRCADCNAWRHPPRYLCAACASPRYVWEPASGRGHVFSWTITHQPLDPAFETPYAVVVVETEEGPRLVGNLRGLEPSDLVLDLPVRIEVEPVSETAGFLWFGPA
jgi:hypothetical protein